MNWDHLRYFERVAEHGSVAAAARNEGVSHATILRAIQRLEHELGLRLFDHLRSGYRLTPEGLELRTHVAAMSREAERILRRARGKGDEPTGEITLSLPEPGIIDLMPTVAEFSKRYEGVSIRVRVSDRMTPAEMLERDIRVAFALTNDPHEELVGRKIGSVKFVVARHRSAPAAHPWIDWSPHFLDSQQLSRLRAASRCTRQDMAVTGYSAALAAVAGGIGSSLISENSLDDSMVAVRGRIEVGIWILTHAEFREDTRVRALMGLFSG